MNKLRINLKKEKNSKSLIRLSSIVLFIFAYTIIITGSTYAFLNLSNNSDMASGQGGCFQVSYTGQNLNAGNIYSTENYLEGAHTTVTLSKDSTCKIYSEANIYIHTNPTTTAPIESNPALRYKILEHTNSKEVAEGLITGKNDYLLTTVPINTTATTYDIYLWIDIDMSLGSYDETSYQGYIYAESSQTSTIENQYLVSFNTNGGNKLNPQIVTYGSTYANLPTPTKSGYTFQGWSLVPSEYQQVEYIQSSGTQYIDTNVLTKQSLEMNCEFSTTTSGRVLFGARTSTTANSLIFGYFTTNSAYVGFGGASTSYTTTLNAMNGNKHKVKLNSNMYTIDNVNQTINNRGTLSEYYSIYLGSWNTAGTADSRMFIGKIYSFSILDNLKLIRNLIPCYKKTDADHPGLCDTVTGHFYGNEGTGNFTKGATQYITNSSTVTQASNHTLYAVWQ